jgi:hypothetical protein
MKFVTLKTPGKILTSTDDFFTILMMLAFLFIIGCKRVEIKSIFDKFDLQMKANFRTYEGRKYKVI